MIKPRELDLSKLTQKDDFIYIYGAGYVGEILGKEMLKRGFQNFAYIDKKQCHNILGKKVYTLQDIVKNTGINIVLGSREYMIEMYEEIQSLHMKTVNLFTASDLFASAIKDERNHVYGENLNYLSYRMKMLELYRYVNNGWSHNHLDVVITEKCTLKCEACSSLMPLYHNPGNCNQDIVFHAMDNLFASGCYIKELVLIGGETMLNQNLVADFYKKYRGNEHIGELVIFTNGTVLPNEYLLDTLKDANDFWVFFSNYGDLSCNQKKAVEMFERNGIVSSVIEEKQLTDENAGIWIDYGYPKHYERSREANQKMYERCYDAKNCTAMINGKIYLCPRIAHGVNAGYIPQQLRRNYVDLIEGFETYDELREHCNRFFADEVYPEACEYCDRENGRPVLRAKQLKQSVRV